MITLKNTGKQKAFPVFLFLLMMEVQLINTVKEKIQSLETDGQQLVCEYLQISARFFH
jgi:hypothetical protein